MTEMKIIAKKIKSNLHWKSLEVYTEFSQYF